MYWGVFIIIWIVAMLVWWLFTSAFRHSDVDKLKNRLMGTTKANAASPTKGTRWVRISSVA